MKRICLVLAMMVFSWSSLSDSYEGVERQYGMTFAPFMALGGVVDTLSIIRLSNSFALTVPLSAGYLWPIILQASSMEEPPITAKAGLGIRYFSRDQGLDGGFFLEPRVSIEYLEFAGKVEVDGPKPFAWKYIALNSSLVIGWDFIAKNGFLFSIGASVGYSYYLVNDLKIPERHFGPFTDALFAKPDATGKIIYSPELRLGFSI